MQRWMMMYFIVVYPNDIEIQVLHFQTKVNIYHIILYLCEFSILMRIILKYKIALQL
jgi:hypothetical protein